MDVIAERLDMAPIRVYEVATFYFMFNMKPVGQLPPAGLQHDALLAARLGRGGARLPRGGGMCRYGETSADGLFTMTEVECLGACVNAPILQVDDDFYEDLDYDSTVQADRGAEARRAADAGLA